MLTGTELGAAIREAIKKKGVPKNVVAAHFGVKPPSIQDWLNRGTIGKDKLPGLWAYFRDVAGPEHWGLEEFPATKTGADASVDPEMSSESLTEYVQDVRGSVAVLVQMLDSRQKSALRNMLRVMLNDRLNLVKLDLNQLRPLLSDNSYMESVSERPSTAVNPTSDLSLQKDTYSVTRFAEESSDGTSAADEAGHQGGRSAGRGGKA